MSQKIEAILVVKKVLEGKKFILVDADNKTYFYQSISRAIVPIFVTDEINVKGIRTKSNTEKYDYTIKPSLFVVKVSDEPENIIDTMVRCSGKGRSKLKKLRYPDAEEIYFAIEETLKASKKYQEYPVWHILNLLHDLFFLYDDVELTDFELIDNFISGFNFAKLRHMFRYWRYERMTRQLFLLNIWNDKILELEEWGFPLAEIVYCCKTNPFKLPNLEPYQQSKIVKGFDLKLNDYDALAGYVLKNLYNSLIEDGHTTLTIQKYYELIKSSFLQSLPVEEKIELRENPKILDKIVGEKITTILRLLNKEYNVKSIKINGRRVFGIKGVIEIEENLSKQIKRLIKLDETDKLLKPDIDFKDEKLTKDQRLAVVTSLSKRISIITGAAGTGKTTVLKEIIHQFSNNFLTVMPCSFTGKAVSRIKEITGAEHAYTIDMLINLRKRGKIDDYDVYLIDEGSMVRTELMNRMFKHLVKNRGVRIVIIGDSNQLPPIGWGHFMNELLKVEEVPVVILKETHRSDDLIVKNANLVLDGKIKGEDSFDCGKNFGIFNLTFDKVVMKMAKALINKMLEKADQDNIMCLCPYNKYLNELNSYFQNYLHPLAISRKGPNGKRWMVGDKVMMICNNYDAGLLNGDVGIIKGFEDTVQGAKVIIRFGVKDHKFRLSKGKGSEETKQYVRQSNMTIDMVVHAYAISVHRSQGSEANHVIMVIPYIASKYISRNLFYTGMTRAKKSFWLFADLDKLSDNIKEPIPESDECLSLLLR